MPHAVHAFVLASFCRLPLSRRAQTLADFYKGKTISILMGTGPGGSYDLYGRTIAEHLGRHIPGRPNIVVEHMPGAGGVVAGNHIYGPARRTAARSCSRTRCRWSSACRRRACSSRPRRCTGSAPMTRSRR